ncbi:unnamed protein product [Vitrella brassicaformis CCMP3155]|uniref:Uncharacterized protein n=1 Tax=Vitrella brassicaformis (strain CCMP3155) TaxID=1169540 RepID=A0A0G4ETK3_VITBC|nr:unnamed protein product [Vitrella brassicaformis CCMP3155]|eukprot:CEM01641.1 unnamed protein product [Vitrella brassicaformis CCMP3155]
MGRSRRCLREELRLQGCLALALFEAPPLSLATLTSPEALQKFDRILTQPLHQQQPSTAPPLPAAAAGDTTQQQQQQQGSSADQQRAAQGQAAAAKPKPKPKVKTKLRRFICGGEDGMMPCRRCPPALRKSLITLGRLRSFSRPTPPSTSSCWCFSNLPGSCVTPLSAVFGRRWAGS